jgi:hypothetical protein
MGGTNPRVVHQQPGEAGTSQRVVISQPGRLDAVRWTASVSIAGRLRCAMRRFHRFPGNLGAWYEVCMDG